jgi:hypothetical protein
MCSPYGGLRSPPVGVGRIGEAGNRGRPGRRVKPVGGQCERRAAADQEGVPVGIDHGELLRAVRS